MEQHQYDLPGAGFWYSITWAAAVAGSLFLILIIALPAIFEGGAMLGPPRMIGALMVGQDPSNVTTGIIVSGVIVHYILSFVFTFILSLLVYRMERYKAVAVGAVFGLGLFLFNFYLMAFAFPWFAEFRNATTLITHLVFGITAAWVFKALKNPRPRVVRRPASPPTLPETLE